MFDLGAIGWLTSVLKMGSGEWGVGSGEWGVGSGEEGFSLFVVRETHGSLAPFSKSFRWALPTNARISLFSF